MQFGVQYKNHRLNESNQIRNSKAQIKPTELKKRITKLSQFESKGAPPINVEVVFCQQKING